MTGTIAQKLGVHPLTLPLDSGTPGRGFISWKLVDVAEHFSRLRPEEREEIIVHFQCIVERLSEGEEW